ncbi:TPA: hypothetical protein R1X61_001666 [Campylobacter upsaliensis]|nr:hypothetical protein [Campylobacter upsaliensis]
MLANETEMMSAYIDDFNHYDDIYPNEEFQTQNNKKSTISKTLNELDEDENLKPALNALNALDENQKHINEKEEQILELTSPKEKQDFLKNTLENSRSNEKIAESLDILEALDENAKLIKEKEGQIKQTQKSLENENNLDKTIDDKADEAYNKQIDELLKQHKSELARLKEERENLEQNFDKSIENLLNSKDLSDILKALQEMDKAFALMLKQAYEEGCALKKQREEKIELAVKSGAMKEVAKDLVKEIHNKGKELNGGLKTMEQEKGAYLSLNTILKNEAKDIKDLEKLEKFYEKTNKELPNFKENYPKIYAKGLKMLETGKQQFLNNTLGQTHFKEQARSMV